MAQSNSRFWAALASLSFVAIMGSWMLAGLSSTKSRAPPSAPEAWSPTDGDANTMCRYAIRTALPEQSPGILWGETPRVTREGDDSFRVVVLYRARHNAAGKVGNHIGTCRLRALPGREWRVLKLDP